MKRYLFMMNTHQLGGAERHIMDIFTFINYDNYAITLGVKKDIFSSFIKKYGLPVRVLEFPHTNGTDGLWTKFIKFYRFFNALKPDCIVFSQFWLKSFSMAELFAAYLITKGNVHMFVHTDAPVHKQYKSKLHFGIMPGLGLEWRKARLLQRLLVCFTKHTITVSKEVSESLIKFHKYPEGKVKVAYHGVDICRFTPSIENRIKFRRGLDIPDSDKIIVSTSRIDKVKRLERVVEAYRSIAQQRKDIHLIFAGAGPQLNELMDRVNSFNEDVRKRVKFLGFQEDVLTILQASDIYVLPSDSEGLGIACLEAMSCGLISVVTDCGGPSEIIKYGWNGFLVEKSSEGILSGLKKALSLNDEERNKLSNNARNFIIENFNLRNNIEHTLTLLGLVQNEHC